MNTLTWKQKSSLREYYAKLRLKPCWICEAVKPVSEFQKNRAQRGGLSNRCKKCQKIYKHSIREKTKAHNAVHMAIEKEIITRPALCEACGTNCKPEGHHHSYKKEHRLDVLWLCKRCHAKQHETSNQEN